MHIFVSTSREPGSWTFSVSFPIFYFINPYKHPLNTLTIFFRTSSKRTWLLAIGFWYFYSSTILFLFLPRAFCSLQVIFTNATLLLSSVSFLLLLFNRFFSMNFRLLYCRIFTARIFTFFFVRVVSQNRNSFWGLLGGNFILDTLGMTRLEGRGIHY